MKVTEIPKGAAITIVATYEDKKVVFESKVMLVSENILLIPPITYNNKTIGFNKNFMIDIHYVENEKLYRFPDVTITLVRYGQALFHKIQTENEGSIYNRRGDYRVYIGQDMHIITHNAKGASDHTVILKDISLSGFAFISREPFNIERTVRLKFRDERLVLDIPGKIVRADWNEHIHSTVYGCKITVSLPVLGRYLIIKQREILQKTRT